MFMAIPLLAAVNDRQCDYGDSIARREWRAKRKRYFLSSSAEISTGTQIELAMTFGINYGNHY